MYHLSRSYDLPDRTRFLVGVSNNNPGHGLARTMIALHAAAARFGQRAVAGVPCNTFHAPSIWSVFLEDVHKMTGGGVQVAVRHRLFVQLTPSGVPSAGGAYAR